MRKVENITFFKRLKIALIDLEKYINFLIENFSKCILYVFEISFILALIFSLANISYVFIKYNSIDDYIKEVVPEFSITDGVIEVSEEDKNNDEKKEAILVIEQLNENLDFNIIKDGYNKSDFINDINSNLKQIIVRNFY